MATNEYLSIGIRTNEWQRNDDGKPQYTLSYSASGIGKHPERADADVKVMRGNEEMYSRTLNFMSDGYIYSLVLDNVSVGDELQLKITQDETTIETGTFEVGPIPPARGGGRGGHSYDR